MGGGGGGGGGEEGGEWSKGEGFGEHISDGTGEGSDSRRREENWV